MDVCAYIPIIGLGVAVAQCVYSIFETLIGIGTFNGTLVHRGVVNLCRSIVQMVPILGFWIMRAIDNVKWDDRLMVGAAW